MLLLLGGVVFLIQLLLIRIRGRNSWETKYGVSQAGDPSESDEVSHSPYIAQTSVHRYTLPSTSFPACPILRMMLSNRQRQVFDTNSDSFKRFSSTCSRMLATLLTLAKGLGSQ